MHFIFGIRGSISQIAEFEQWAHHQMFIWWRWNLNVCECNKDLTDFKPTKKHAKGCKRFKRRKEPHNCQGVLRKMPFGFYEYIFPKEHLAEVLTMFQVQAHNNHWKEGFKLRSWLIRKAMGNGIKPMPEYTAVITNRYIETRGIALYPIGIKEDEIREHKSYGYYQELL